MPLPDASSMAGPGFRSTAWSVIQEAKDPDSPEHRDSLERLFRVYWRPVYWTLRLEWNENPENARDLTQQYFAMFLEKDLLRQVSASKGRFRNFVKATLKNFMLMDRRETAALKRGGDRRLFSLDAADVEPLEARGAERAPSPEQLFDRELMKSVMEESLADLRREMEAAGRRNHFELFVRYYSSDVSYDSLAAETKASVTDIGNWLTAVRRRYREMVMSRLRDGVSTPEELSSEALDLLGE